MEENTNSEKVSLWKRVYGVLWASPARTMEDIIQRPLFWGAAALILGIHLILTIITLPKIKEYTAWTLQNLPTGYKFSAQEMEMALNAAMVSSIAGTLLFPLIMWVIIAALMKLFNAFSGEKTKFSTLFAVTVFADLPAVIDAILRTALLMVSPARNMTGITISPAIFMETPDMFPGKLYTFLSQMDPFIFWALALTALGGSLAMKVPFGRLAVYLGCLWVVFALGMTMLSGLGRGGV